MAKAGNQGLVRINNQNAIIEYIRDHGPVSRADLSKILKISKPTVSTNVEALLQRNILLEVGPGTTSIGKKPTLLEFNKNHKLVLACDLSREHPYIALGNLIGDILAESKVQILDAQKSSVNHEAFICALDSMFEGVFFDKTWVDQVVIASPGIFPDHEAQQLLNPQFTHLQAVKIDNLLESYFGKQVQVHNDINMAALGEHQFGAGKGYSNLVYVSVGLGVGAGLIINDELYLGSRKAAGEIGFVIPLTSKNVSGSIVNLENTIGERAIEQRLAEEAKISTESSVFEKSMTPSYGMFVDAVLNKDSLCCQLATNNMNHLAMAMANVSVVLDFECIIVGGSILSLGENYIKQLDALVNVVTPLETRVVASKLRSAEIYGAIKVGIDSIFKGLVIQ